MVLLFVFASVAVPGKAFAVLHCGTAVIDGGGVVTKEDYCYDDGFPGAPGPAGPSGGGGGGAGGGGGGGGPALPNTIDQLHDVTCASTYGKYGPNGAVTSFASDWAWVIDPLNVKAETNIKVPPPPMGGYDWTMIDGDTVNIGEPSMESILYRHAYVTRKNTIQTLEHEFAHQNGIMDEDEAEAFGKVAADAYEADDGSLCGGL